MSSILLEKLVLPFYYYCQQKGIKSLPWETLASKREFSNKTIAIVGNAGYLLSQKNGQFIDSHNLVLRMNNFVTEGYEEHVGEKIDIYLSNFFYNIEFKNIKKKPPHWIISSVPNNFFKSKEAQLTTYHAKHITNGMKIIGEKTLFSPLTENYNKYTMEVGTKPSTGLMAMILAKEILSPVAKEIFITGFSFFHGKNHYFSESKADTTTHNSENEIKFARKLILENQARNISLDETMKSFLGIPKKDLHGK